MELIEAASKAAQQVQQISQTAPPQSTGWFGVPWHIWQTILGIIGACLVGGGGWQGWKWWKS